MPQQSGSFVNGVWTERKVGDEARRFFSARQSVRDDEDARRSSEKTETIRGKWRSLAARLVMLLQQRDIYRTAMARPAPQTPSKSARTDNISPLGVEEFDPDDPIPDDACAVCFSSLSKGAVTLPCGHRFHESCVRGVYAYQQACPMCRDETPLTLTPRRRTDEDVSIIGSPLKIGCLITLRSSARVPNVVKPSTTASIHESV